MSARRAVRRAEPQLSGSTGDLERLASMAAAATASAPKLDAVADRIVNSFVRSTANERNRYRDGPPADASPSQTTSRRTPSRFPTAAGGALLVITLLAAITAAVPPLPAKASLDIDPTFATPISTVAGIVCTAAALLGALLPAWGSQEARDQTWKSLYAGAAVLVIGLIAGSGGIGVGVEAGSGIWAAWVASLVVAVGASVAAAEVRRRRRPASEDVPVVPPPDADGDYFRAISGRRRRASQQIDSALTADRVAADAVDRRWRTAIQSARSDGVLSGKAASSAESMSAFRWRLEYAAEPDLGSDE